MTPPASFRSSLGSLAAAALAMLALAPTALAAAPDTSLDSGPNSVSQTTTPHFTFSSNPLGAGFDCQLDQGPWTNCDSGSYTSAPLADGQHVFQVRARSGAEVDPTPASLTFLIDNQPPRTQEPVGPSGSIASTDASYSFSGEIGSSFLCQLDGSGLAPCSSPVSYSNLSQGAHSFELEEVDLAGNQGTVVQVNFIVDSLAPETTLIDGPGAVVRQSSQHFQVSSSEPSVTYRCQLDGAIPYDCPAEVVLNEFPNGAHVFSMYAIDSAGNADPTPVVWKFQVDTSESAPVTLGAAALSGKPKIGKTLNCVAPSFSGGTITLSFNWLLDGRMIEGATDQSYTLLGPEFGRTISCRVSARNAGGLAIADSNPIVITERADPVVSELKFPARLPNAKKRSAAQAKALARCAKLKGKKKRACRSTASAELAIQWKQSEKGRVMLMVQNAKRKTLLLQQRDGRGGQNRWPLPPSLGRALKSGAYTITLTGPDGDQSSVSFQVAR